MAKILYWRKSTKYKHKNVQDQERTCPICSEEPVSKLHLHLSMLIEERIAEVEEDALIRRTLPFRDKDIRSARDLLTLLQLKKELEREYPGLPVRMEES